MAAKQVHTVAKLSVTALIGVFMFLNIIPWITASQQLAANLPALVGLFDWLYNIPLIGWVIRGLVENLAIVCGFILWGNVLNVLFPV
jgi:hypothetical protein